MRLIIAITILITVCSNAFGEDRIMVCAGDFSDDIDYLKLTNDITGLNRDLQQKFSGVWHSECDEDNPSYEGSSQTCEFLDEAVMVTKIYEKRSKTETIYDFELQILEKWEYEWDDEKKAWLFKGIKNDECISLRKFHDK